MEARRITLALQDESQGYAISPSRVPLGTLTTFAEQVQGFLRGSDGELNAAAVQVSVVTGSLAFSSEPLIAPALFHDLSVLNTTADLADIDPKRRLILEQWQESARTVPSRMVRILAEGMDPILVSHNSMFRAKSEEPWVEVERYVHGELMDLGGVRSANAHIKLPDGSRLVVRTDRDLIKAEKQNKVYQTVHVRIRAKYNVRTGELRDPVLMEFVEYAPSFDEAAFNTAVENGTSAWAAVGDPAEWVRNMRGAAE